MRQQRAAKAGDEATGAKCQAEITALTEKIVASINAYAELTGTGEHAEVKFAYVVFRSMEGKARLCEAYNYPYPWSRNSVWLACCGRKRGATEADKHLHESADGEKSHFLEVEEAPQPSLILWQNLGVTVREQWLRRLLSFLVAAALVAAIAACVTALKAVSDSAKAGFAPPGGDCPAPLVGSDVVGSP